MRIAVICAALVSAFSAADAGAQSLTLTEADALARLSADSPRARAARTGVEIARADVVSARRWPNPRITYDREAVTGIAETIVIVAQPLPVTGRRGFEVQAASALVDATSSRADEDIRRLRADLRLAFADLIVAQAREAQLIESRDRLRGLADTLAKREEAGDAPGFDRLRAEREVLDLDTDRALAATERARAQAILAAFFADVREPSTIVAVGRTTQLADLPSVEALLERAERTRGELLALRREVEAAGFAQRAAERRRIPEPEIVAGTKSSTALGGDVGSVVMVHASIPLFDRGAAERALALARASQAEARAAAFRSVLRGQVAALRASVIERRDLAARYQTQAVSSADQIERIAQVSYDAGERTILELLEAYRTGASARLRQAALDAAVRQAEIELEFVSGWEIQ
jgi:cobalt-zinc-cadmium efflux system outer membrane protein